MQTIEEYKAYTKQLEADVGKWHHAYDALMVERNQLVSRIKDLERQHEVECDLSKARIKELERQLKKKKDYE